MEEFVPHDPYTRAPSRKAPAGSCDCHFHIFADPAKYPARQDGSYQPPHAYADDIKKMHASLGIDRGVICQATIYGTDHRLMLDSLEAHPNWRGTAIIDNTISDAELERMNAAGVRAARFNFARFLNIVPDEAVVRRTVDRITQLGWHIKIFGDYEEILEHVPYLRSLNIPIVIDHLGRLDFTKGPEQPLLALLESLLKNENWWIMLSNGDRFSPGGAPYLDTVPLARKLFAAAPDRTIWSTDWPHVRYRRPMPNDADLLELLYQYLPDEADQHKVLVDNPARLFGFK
ncbi:amidohydrolase family protein [Roseiarcaceae bacterium H3SJ34-1]|uniref:amidohydrolase family protein n=1 Tax=Terripilifer ovatus TaxID=3032367 RepID=UPI003AB97327|nr:amidohydrolase family protein [Roseiarcaceae bacterium H3SJ34-1]